MRRLTSIVQRLSSQLRYAEARKDDVMGFALYQNFPNLTWDNNYPGLKFKLSAATHLATPHTAATYDQVMQVFRDEHKWPSKHAHDHGVPKTNDSRIQEISDNAHKAMGSWNEAAGVFKIPYGNATFTQLIYHDHGGLFRVQVLNGSVDTVANYVTIPFVAANGTNVTNWTYINNANHFGDIGAKYYDFIHGTELTDTRCYPPSNETIDGHHKEQWHVNQTAEMNWKSDQKRCKCSTLLTYTVDLSKENFAALKVTEPTRLRLHWVAGTDYVEDESDDDEDVNQEDTEADGLRWHTTRDKGNQMTTWVSGINVVFTEDDEDRILTNRIGTDL